MNLDYSNIMELLEKYYDGSTSLREEALLKDYFLYQSVPAELAADKELFMFFAAKDTCEQVDTSPELLLENFIKKNLNEPDKKAISIWPVIGSIAACLAVILTSYLYVYKDQKSTKMKDTYNDPRLAYLETKRALEFISQHFSKASGPLKNVSRLNEGMTHFTSLASFETGYTKLDLLSKYVNKTVNETIKK